MSAARVHGWAVFNVASPADCNHWAASCRGPDGSTQLHVRGNLDHLPVETGRTLFLEVRKEYIAIAV